MNNNDIQVVKQLIIAFAVFAWTMLTVAMTCVILQNSGFIGCFDQAVEEEYEESEELDDSSSDDEDDDADEF